MVCAVLLWGGAVAIAKFLFNRAYDPLMIVQMRSTLSFVIIAPWFAVRDRSVFRIATKDIPLFAFVGIVGLAITNYTYYYTVSQATVATAILIQYIAPALVMVYMVLIAKQERGDITKALALIIAFAGCYLAVKTDGAGLSLPGWSVVTGPTTAVTFAVMMIGAKTLLKRYSQWTVLTYIFGFAGLFWLFVHPPWAIVAEHYGWEDWGVFLMFAVISVLVPYIFFTAALKRLEASTVGIVGTLEPIVAIVAAWFLVGESLTRLQFVGAAAVLLAVGLLQMRGGGAEVPEEHA